nr:hypothetical protein [Thauera butanivorans]
MDWFVLVREGCSDHTPRARSNSAHFADSSSILRTHSASSHVQRSSVMRGLSRLSKPVEKAITLSLQGNQVGHEIQERFDAQPPVRRCRTPGRAPQVEREPVIRGPSLTEAGRLPFLVQFHTVAMLTPKSVLTTRTRTNPSSGRA